MFTAQPNSDFSSLLCHTFIKIKIYSIPDQILCFTLVSENACSAQLDTHARKVNSTSDVSNYKN